MILLTGGHGFIGSRVSRELHRRGYDLRLLLRRTSQPARVADLPYEPAWGDVRDRDSLRAAARGCEGIVHLASPSSWAELGSSDMPAIVVEGTHNVLQAAREQAGARVLYVSSVVAVGGTWQATRLDEDSPFELPDNSWWAYAQAKHRAERLCQEAFAQGLPVVCVNPAEVYGPQDTACVTAGTLLDFARGYPVLASRGGVCVAHVEDVAAGIAAAYERGRPGQRYILGGDNLSVVELARLTLELLGLRKPIVRLPAMVLMGLAWLHLHTGLPIGFEARVAPYANRFWHYDNRKARRELGVSFRGARDTLESTLSWLQEVRLLPS